jgi:hypothetical protein
MILFPLEFMFIFISKHSRLSNDTVHMLLSTQSGRMEKVSQPEWQLQSSSISQLNSTQLNSTNCNSSCLRSSLYSLGVDPQKASLPLLLRVDSLLKRCVYRTVAQLRERRGPKENVTCCTSSIVAWRNRVRDAFFCWHYLATDVSLPPQFLLWVNKRYDTGMSSNPQASPNF